MTGPGEEYRRRVDAGLIAADPSQAEAMQALDRLHSELAGTPSARGWRRRLARLARRPVEPAQGVYLWGGVGRGKTFMLDLFFQSLPFDDKIRLHFHRFMALVHAELKRLRQLEEPLDHVADGLAARTRILCFDELTVTDIADAMILRNLFAALFARGVTLAATSNLAPRDLYRGGLQRQRFLPAIELILKHTEIVHVGGNTDYRLQFLEQADTYLSPVDATAERRLNSLFEAVAPDAIEERGQIELLGRAIEFRRASDGVIWFDFAQICTGPRSQDDYIELARLYQTVLVSNVPRFDRSVENEARRFIALVDEFYDRRVKLILSAHAEPAALYRGHKLEHDFERTRSRLEEMRSHDYLAAAHRP